MSFTFQNPFSYFNNPANSNPVGLGKLYIGLPDTDPITPANQIPVYAVQPDGSELQIPQPVRTTAGGVVTYNGVPIQLKVSESTYSVRIDSSTNAQLYYTPRVETPIDDGGTAASINSVKSLQSVTKPAVDTIYDVIGYYEDTTVGGGGFVWEATRPYSDHNGGTVIAPPAIAAWDGTQADIATLLNWTGSGVGCWVRVNAITLTPEMFGAVGGVVDDTLSIQSVIDYAKSMTSFFSSSGGVNVNFSASSYSATKITRRSGVTLVGAGSRSTIFFALPQSAPSGQDPVYGLFEIENGPVVNSGLKGMCICGSSTPTGTTAVNANQWGIYSRAKWNASFTEGGLWHSGYDDVWVRGFNYGEWSRAGYTNAHSRLPNQFITYNDMTVQVCAGGEARRFTGQHGQISVQNGDSGALDSLVASLVCKFDWDPNPSQVASNTNGESTTDVSGVGNAVRTPEQIQFSAGAAIQRANKGCYVRNTRGVSFDGCWFESLGGSFELATNGGASVSNTRFANAADGNRLSPVVTNGGYIVKHGTNTNFDFGIGNFITGVRDQFVDASVNLTDIISDRHNPSSRVTDGKFNVASPATLTASSVGAIDVKGLNYVYARAYQTDLSVPIITISSMLVPSDILTIRAWTGSITFSNSGGNLKLGSGDRQSVTIPENGYITFMRVHGFSGVEWVMQSYNEHYSDTLPSAGYFSRGHKIWKNNPTPAESAGWICTTAGIAGSTAVFSAMPSRALDSFTVATLPSASANTRQSIYVSDMSGGAAPAYSNGTNWARYSDNTTVS